ncbi:type II toxin-antitoxin system RelE/ParE family toxin [Aureimonas ureilytica]|uniref:type II toxin-antitoxin system RelE/ParE family toxin n=1 Tax=Aureimonas ureilytica TaxID=401562 RepID=UPI0009EC50D2|nr:type II toxin-antitoxin system RelE/ParE family toxin [Aureimonas ureilytica]
MPKEVFWMGNSRASIRAFPREVKQEVGFALDLAQKGERAINSIPLSHFGSGGVIEVVSDFDTDTYRAVYTVCLENAVYVLHAFQKKSTSGRKTPKREMDLVRARLKAAKADHAARLVDRNKEKANARSER